MADEWQEIGRIVSVHPARRELRVSCAHETAEALEAADWILVGLGRAPLRCKIESTHYAGTQVVVRLAAGVPRERIGPMRHAPVSIAAGLLRQEASTAWAAEDLEGCMVMGPGQVLLGKVVEVIVQPAHAVIVLERPDGAHWLLPAVPALVQRIDSPGRILEVGDVTPFVVVEDEDDAD